jgi:hypothetical protein
VTLRVHLPSTTDVPSVSAALSATLLEEQAGWLIFERGLAYADHGHVTALEETDAEITAVVLGSSPYQVLIRLADALLTFDCSCPMGDDRAFCKHLVAVGLEVAGDDPDAQDPLSTDDVATHVRDVDHGGIRREGHGNGGGQQVDLGQIEAWLAGQPAERLRELLADRATRDPDLGRHLARLAAAEGQGRLELTPYRAAITDVFAFATFDDVGYVHYRDAWAWRHDVEAVLDDLDGLLESGFGVEVVDLAELALVELNDSVGHIDDSDGHLYDLFERTMALHLAACRQAPPDPDVLAEKLFRWALHFELDSYLGAVGDYAAVLGDDGLAAYRTLAEEHWADVPPLTTGDDPRNGFTDRFRIRTIMEHLAAATGGLDDLLEVMARDQSSGYAFLRIAEACQAHGRDDLALDWAERGRAAFPAELRLLELLVDLHTAASRPAQALDTARELFTRAPSLATYRRLRACAESCDAWPDEREPALTGLRDAIERQRSQTATSQSPWQRDDGSTLVEILSEDDANAAWTAAEAYGCRPDVELQLAKRRADQHPADALAVYRRHLDRALKPAKDHAYAEVARLLTLMRPLHQRLGQDADFARLVTQIRTEYKRRRNLIKRLDRAQL